MSAPAVTRLRAVVADARPVAFEGIAAIEGELTDDNGGLPRVLLPKSLSWETPVPFMAQTRTSEGHEGAEVAGRIDSFRRVRADDDTWDVLFRGELTTPYGIEEIAPMIDDETLRGVSVDLGSSEWVAVHRDTLAEVAEDEFSMEDLAAGRYAAGLKSGKIKAVTLVPTPALGGATVALAASAEGEWSFRSVSLLWPPGDAEALTASPAPVRPPRSWFETSEPGGKMPLTVTAEGRVFGHLATFDSCHVGFLPSCVPPPRSPSRYSFFHVCELDTADGESVEVGKLMFSPGDGGHADRRLSPQRAAAYYDRTGMAAAYLHASDGEHGIWVAGALNPDLSDEQREQMRRELRLHPPSGDWRPVNGGYELICALAVAVPGFPVPRGAGAAVTVVASAEGLELTEAIIASSGWFDPDEAALAGLEAQGVDVAEVHAGRRLRTLGARAEGLDALAALAD